MSNWLCVNLVSIHPFVARPVAGGLSLWFVENIARIETITIDGSNKVFLIEYLEF